MPDIRCDICGATRATSATRAGEPRLSRGWKRLPGGVHCAACVVANWRIRAVEMAVAEVLEGGREEFRQASLTAWRATQRLANRCATWYFTADSEPHPDGRMRPMPKTYLYPQARAAVPELPPRATVQIDHSVAGNYRESRAAVHRGEASLRTYRFPQPYALPADGEPCRWVEYEGEHGQSSRVPAVQMRMGDERFLLRLAGGPEWRRQTEGFSQIVSGEAQLVEVVLRGRRANGGDRRSSQPMRTPGSGSRGTYRRMVKLVAWFPYRPSSNRKPRTMAVRSGPHAWLIAEAEGRSTPWVLRNNQVRRWIRAHADKIEGGADDLKAECRPMKESERDRLKRMSTRYNDRMTTWARQSTGYLVAFAQRMRVGSVALDLADHRYCPSAPWDLLKRMLREGMDRAGIVVHDAASAAVVESE